MQMRTAAEFEALRDPARDYDLPSDVGMVDWSAHADTVLAIVDELLARNGLEIVTYDTQSDDHAFKIEPRRGAGRHVTIEQLRGE